MNETNKVNETNESIVKIEEFAKIMVDENDQESVQIITKRIPIDNPVNSSFHGTVGITVSHEGATLPLPLTFPKEYSLQECFDNFEYVAKEAVEELKRKAQNHASNQIVTPSNKIIMP